MSDTDKQKAPNDLDTMLNAIAKGVAYNSRSPVLRWPDEAGLEWEDVYFLSADGTALEGWFIPRAGSDKLIISAHAFGFSKAGFPSHIEPWKSAWGPGNDYEINFIPDYKLLHDHGYNVLAYDFRNHGHSAAANAGLNSNNRFELRDVVGSLAYVRSRPDLASMTIGLFSRCMGANATFRALATDPEPFAGVRCLVAPLLLSARVALDRMVEGAGLADHADEADRRQRNITGILLSEASPVDWAPSVTLPTLTYGVRDDAVTRSSDLEAIFEAIGTDEKSMFWIDGTTSRWDGYTWFQRHPERILEWFDKYMR
jgi:pimeloyl-ACP methyl ester carboxylesterase